MTRVSTVTGKYQQTLLNEALRPAHVRGQVGEDVWFETCDDAFVAAMRAELFRRARQKLDRRRKASRRKQSRAKT